MTIKERPILFQTNMVVANLEGRKTNTRRSVNRLASFGAITEFKKSDTKGYDWTFRDKRMLWNDISNERLLECCPYGAVGDRLWVRESWSTCPIYDNQKPSDMDADYLGTIRYLADGNRSGKLRPSIFMPRWASRILLEVTERRVESLSDISREDAIAEGIERVGGQFSCSPWRNYRIGKPNEMNMHCSCPERSYMTLWESINGQGSWADNHFVWVITYKIVETKI